MIHHISIPANNPSHVADVLARLLLRRFIQVRATAILDRLLGRFTDVQQVRHHVMVRDFRMRDKRIQPRLVVGKLLYSVQIKFHAFPLQRWMGWGVIPPEVRANNETTNVVVSQQVNRIPFAVGCEPIG